MSDRNQGSKSLLRVQPITGNATAKTDPLLVSGTCKKIRRVHKRVKNA